MQVSPNALPPARSGRGTLRRVCQAEYVCGMRAVNTGGRTCCGESDGSWYLDSFWMKQKGGDMITSISTSLRAWSPRPESKSQGRSEASRSLSVGLAWGEREQGK